MTWCLLECERDEENDELVKKMEADRRQRQEALREKELQYQLDMEQNRKNRYCRTFKRACARGWVKHRVAELLVLMRTTYVLDEDRF